MAEAALDLFSCAGEWIAWDGGPQPVSDDTIVSVRYRPGLKTAPATESTPARAAWFRIGSFDWWRHHSPDPVNDIVAYRVIRPAPEGEANG